MYANAVCLLPREEAGVVVLVLAPDNPSKAAKPRAALAEAIGRSYTPSSDSDLAPPNLRAVKQGHGFGGLGRGTGGSGNSTQAQRRT